MSEEGKKEDKISEVEVKEEQSQPQQALEIEENAQKLEQKEPEQSKESLDQRSEKIEQKDVQTQKQAMNTEQQEHSLSKAAQEHLQSKAVDIKNLHEQKHSEDVSSEPLYIVPPTPEQLLRAEDESRQKQKLINQILRMYDDFERLQIRSEQLKQQNHYFIDKINEFEQIIYEDDSTP